MYWIRSGIVILRSRRLLFVVAGMKKRKTMQNRQKSNAKKNPLHFLSYLYSSERTSTCCISLFNVECHIRELLVPFYNVFGMTQSLTGDWIRDLPHSKASTLPLGYRGGGVGPIKTQDSWTVSATKSQGSCVCYSSDVCDHSITVYS